MNSVIFLTNILLTSIEFFSELIELMKKINIFWKTWENISYNFQKNIWEIDADVYIQMKDFKFKKAGKLLSQRKKMILIEFWNSIIYRLYDWETDLIIISINIDINKKKNEIFSEKSSFIKIKDSLTDQLFSEFLMTISAEISSTFNFLTVRVSSAAKSVLMILHHFFCRAVKAVFKNINLSDSANFTFQSVKVISDSDSQAVRIISSACRSCSWSWKKVASIVQQVQKLTWMKLILAYFKNFYRQSIKLTQILLAKQNAVLFKDSDVYFWSFR